MVNLGARDGVILFGSTHHALKAEKVLREHGFKIMLIPVPRHLSSDCGIAIKFDFSLRDYLSSLLREKKVVVTGVHPLISR